MHTYYQREKNSNLANNNTENMTKKNKIREMNRMYYYERQQGMVEKRQAKKENYHIIPQILPAQ
jgi:actin-related protein